MKSFNYYVWTRNIDGNFCLFKNVVFNMYIFVIDKQ